MLKLIQFCKKIKKNKDVEEGVLIEIMDLLQEEKISRTQTRYLKSYLSDQKSKNLLLVISFSFFIYLLKIIQINLGCF